ncbi:MAG: T9SS type A sorting domain-containing protein [Bacteroidia bacterium]
MKRFLSIFSPVLFLFSFGLAQSINVHYEIRSGVSTAPDTVIVYMQSTTTNTVSIRAVNFSFAYQFGCAAYDSYTSIFPNKWSSFFQRHLIRRNLSLTYGSASYDSRWLYAIGDANLTTNSVLVIPNNTQPMLEVMRVAFSGSCTPDIYMEDQSENPVNQIADQNLNSLGYNVFRLNGPPNLPVEYLGWEARPLADGTAKLEWATSAELNNDYFVVEKSYAPDFSGMEEIARIEGKGTPVDEASYSLIDNGLMQEQVYYRLRQVDFDGTWQHTDVRQVNFETLSPDLGLTVYPNPTKDRVKIQVSFAEDMRLSLMLFDKRGRLVRTMETLANNVIEFPLGNLPPGVYHLQATGRHNGLMINQTKSIILTQ